MKSEFSSKIYSFAMFLSLIVGGLGKQYSDTLSIVGLTVFSVLFIIMAFHGIKKDKIEKEAYKNLSKEAEKSESPDILGTSWSYETESESGIIEFRERGQLHARIIDKTRKKQTEEIHEGSWRLSGKFHELKDAHGKRLALTNKDTGGVIIDVQGSVMTLRDYLHASVHLKRT